MPFSSKTTCKTRALALAWLVGCLCAWVLPSLAQGEAEPAKPFTAFIASDLHYLSPRLGTEGAAYQANAHPRDGKAILYIDLLVDAFVEEIIAKKPDVVLLSGDLTFNGERYSHEDLAKKLARIDPALTRVYVIPGNHDIENVYASSFAGDDLVPAEPLTAEQFADLYGPFGESLRLLDKTFGLDYSVENETGPWFLMLDTCQYTSNQALGHSVPDGMVDNRLFPWMRRVAERAKAAARPLITVTHHNLYRHHPTLRTSYTLENNGEFFAFMQDTGIALNFSGHSHVQSILSYEGITEVISEAFSVYPHQYGVLLYVGDRLTYDTQNLDVAGYVQAQGLTDPNLVHYDSYARALLDATLSNMEGHMNEAWTPEQQKEVAALIADLNAGYFAGEPVPEGIKERPAYQLILQDKGFLGKYIQGILEEDGVSDQHWEMAFPARD